MNARFQSQWRWAEYIKLFGNRIEIYDIETKEGRDKHKFSQWASRMRFWKLKLALLVYVLQDHDDGVSAYGH